MVNKMKFKLPLQPVCWILLSLLTNLAASLDAEIDYPVGDPRKCFVGKNDQIYRFEVIPGGGWDNLMNKDTGMIMELNYSRCRTTDDGRFLIPDNMYTVPIKSSKVETYAELITHWDNYTSTLSKSVNVHGGLHFSSASISGKYSEEYKSVKSRQYYDKSMTTRIQARYVLYTAMVEPSSVINDAFRSRLQKIATYVTLNRTDLARYESQLLVRDYGTHVITSIDVGAALVQIDELSAHYVRKYDSEKHRVVASASASFFGAFDFGGSYSETTTKTMIDEYKKERTSSAVMTIGGPAFRYFPPRDESESDLSGRWFYPCAIAGGRWFYPCAIAGGRWFYPPAPSTTRCYLAIPDGASGFSCTCKSQKNFTDILCVAFQYKPNKNEINYDLSFCNFGFLR